MKIELNAEAIVAFRKIEDMQLTIQLARELCVYASNSSDRNKTLLN